MCQGVMESNDIKGLATKRATVSVLRLVHSTLTPEDENLSSLVVYPNFLSFVLWSSEVPTEEKVLTTRHYININL